MDPDEDTLVEQIAHWRNQPVQRVLQQLRDENDE